MHLLIKLATAAAAFAGTAALGGCATDRGYGYTGVQVGYGAGYGSPYWGWNDRYYYPGTGVYVYDNNRRRYRWNQAQRSYWEGRRSGWHGDRRMRSNWRDFRGPRGGRGPRSRW